MVKASKGVLVKVDPSIKAIIIKIDTRHHDIVIEELDDEHLVVKESKLAELKDKLYQELKDSQVDLDESESE
ncbi:MAG: hypothetical protein M1831_005632 [Alyxoria varia]|nr:MAG: hypothetical protein M1831_005632 [Alyxoria varia]